MSEDQTNTAPSNSSGVAEQPIVPKPLFVPLKTEYYEAFCDGTKTVEYRLYGPRWNERTCQVGRRVTISKGYGKQHRRTGTVIGFEKSKEATWSKAFRDCYGHDVLMDYAACIEIQLDEVDARTSQLCLQ